MVSKYKKYGKGWFNESERHRLAAKGVKTKKFDILPGVSRSEKLKPSKGGIKAKLKSEWDTGVKKTFKHLPKCVVENADIVAENFMDMFHLHEKFGDHLYGLGADRAKFFKYLEKNGWKLKKRDDLMVWHWEAYKDGMRMRLEPTHYDRIRVEYARLGPKEFNKMKDQLKHYPTVSGLAKGKIKMIYVGGLGESIITKNKTKESVSVHYIEEEDGTKSWQLLPDESRGDTVLKTINVIPQDKETRREIAKSRRDLLLAKGISK